MRVDVFEQKVYHVLRTVIAADLRSLSSKKPLLLYYRLLLLIIIDNHNDHHWISFFYKIQKVASCGVSYELTCLFAHDIVYSHSRRSRGQKRPQRLGSWMKFKLPFFLKRKNYSTDFKLLYLGFISQFVFMVDSFDACSSFALKHLAPSKFPKVFTSLCMFDQDKWALSARTRVADTFIRSYKLSECRP